MSIVRKGISEGQTLGVRPSLPVYYGGTPGAAHHNQCSASCVWEVMPALENETLEINFGLCHETYKQSLPSRLDDQG